MSETAEQTIELLKHLPGEWPQELLATIREENRRTGGKVVILDDDPTGTQTSKDVPVLTGWGVGQLREELAGPADAFFVLTNSRSLPVDEACKLAAELGENLKEASRAVGVDISLISRSDSTLRGHFPQEVDAVAEKLGKQHQPYLLIPFFLEGGRLTIDNIHYVREGDKLIPAAQTPFAQDAVFGFSRSDLRDWVEEKTGGRIPAAQVVVISLEDIRLGGPARVAEILSTVADRGACIVNAASYRDMEVVVSALQTAEQKGRGFLCRTAASFVRTRNGVPEDLGLLGKDELVSTNENGGVFLVGSYVKKTTQQVKNLLTTTDIVGLEVEVQRLLMPEMRSEEIERTVQLANKAIGAGDDIVIFTSRDLITGNTDAHNLEIGQLVSDSLIEIVKGFTKRPRFLVAKGGITSSDVATKGLAVQRAMVIGQIQPGVPVWQLGPEARYPGMSYIVYPGNVGDEKGLSAIQKLLTRVR